MRPVRVFCHMAGLVFTNHSFIETENEIANVIVSKIETEKQTKQKIEQQTEELYFFI